MRRWLPVLGLLFVVMGFVWWAVRVSELGSPDRGEASGFGQFVLAGVGLVIVLGDLAVKTITAAREPDVDRLADDLASVVLDQWDRAAAERRLVQPAPLLVRWQRCTARVAGPPSAATATRDGHVPFPPLPGLDSITTSAVRTGSRTTLYRVYGGLPSGRLILVGGPGSGKSSAAVLLLLDALRHRQGADSPERRLIPVPVLLTFAGWNPATTPFDRWLVERLAQTAALKGLWSRRNAEALVREKRVAVFLDGLDEVPESIRAAALRVLSEQATVRIVLLSRTAELIEAAVDYPLTGAVALELLPLRPKDVAEYLLRPLTQPASASWQALTRALATDPASPVAQALTSPLNVGLLRDIYQATSPVDDLLDTTRFPTIDAITHHLLDDAVTAAYTPRPGRPRPRYSPHTARRTLTVVANEMTKRGTRDLTWWTMSSWLPDEERINVTALLFLPLFLLMFYPASGTLLALGFAFAVSYTLAIVPRSIMVIPTMGRWWRFAVIVLGLAIGPVVVGLNLLIPGFVLDVAVAGGLVVLATSAIVLGSTLAPRSSSPSSTFRGAQVFGLVLGAVSGALSSVFITPSFGPPVGAMFWLLFSRSGPLLVTQVWFAVLRRTPLRLIRFLEDARSKHLLRTVGPIYQFRHAMLQERLAATGGPGEAPTEIESSRQA